MNQQTLLTVAIVAALAASIFTSGILTGRMTKQDTDAGLLADTAYSWYIAGKASGRAECTK